MGNRGAQFLPFVGGPGGGKGWGQGGGVVGGVCSPPRGGGSAGGASGYLLFLEMFGISRITFLCINLNEIRILKLQNRDFEKIRASLDPAGTSK